MSPSMASRAAVGQAYQLMVREATMLSYKNAFLLLSIAVVCLSPLPFLMRLPPKRVAKPAAEELAVH